ncbi:MAG: ParB N-terminal domain-containing protein [Treponema sp.]|nr:ParB N-terminal domain-containing protein [Spirochaetia bacterium]MDD7013885.1 ParB N-terminal domain-containing protein [Spirochaetales bacterium]MDY4903025.1 ParB N-terminal domain-containing protein [Treponema sp.]
MLVKISDIKVKKRVRKDLGDLEPLKDSLRTYGLMNPITLNSENELIAGERRLEAAKAIGWENIDANIISKPVTELSQLEMELEENNQRKEFTDEELMEGYNRLKKLRNPSVFRKILRFFKKLFCSIFSAIASFFKKIFGANKS